MTVSTPWPRNTLHDRTGLHLCHHSQPELERCGALPIHLPSFNSCRTQTAMLLRLSNIPSRPSPTMLAQTGWASPLVRSGTLR